MHRREGVLYGVRPAPVVDEDGYQTTFPPRFCPFPLAFSRFPLALHPLLLLISSDPTLYLGFPFLFYFLACFFSFRFVFMFHGKVDFFFLSWRIIKVLSYIKLNMIARTIHHVSVIYF